MLNMKPATFSVTKCPNNELSLLNRVIVSLKDYQSGYRYIKFHNRGQLFHFTCLPDRLIEEKYLGFSMVQRKWAYVGINQGIQVEMFSPNKKIDAITEKLFEIDFYRAKEMTGEPVNTDNLVKSLTNDFADRWFVLDEKLIVFFNGLHYLLLVKELKTQENEYKQGLMQGTSKIIFQNAEGSPICLSGKSQTRRANSSIINPDFDFNSLAIGGLGEEFKEIFRRAFASRILPPDIVEKMGAKHVKGILLHGPPGCGKTLMARQIGKMLSAREPQVVNGPEILNKFVGESEAHIRKLFDPAEKEKRKSGVNSGLHIIIFDRIDAIYKQRGTVAGASRVHALLSKMDQFDNILVIGTTNRLDLIDEALMGPGKLEVIIKFVLPDERGRLEILQIHCSIMMKSNMVQNDVDFGHNRTLRSVKQNEGSDFHKTKVLGKTVNASIERSIYWRSLNVL